MRIVALDLSLTATGVCDSQAPTRPNLIKSPGKMRGPARLLWILREVEEITRGADLVLIEGYAFARPNQAHQIGELGGVIRVGLHVRGRPYVEISPSTVKKLATGTGSAKKEAVLAEAIRRLGYDGRSTDEADSMWLLQAGLIHYGLPGAVALPKTHLEALEKIGFPVMEVAA